MPAKMTLPILRKDAETRAEGLEVLKGEVQEAIDAEAMFRMTGRPAELQAYVSELYDIAEALVGEIDKVTKEFNIDFDRQNGLHINKLSNRQIWVLKGTARIELL